VSPVKYEQGFYIPEDDILHVAMRSHFSKTGVAEGRSQNRSVNHHSAVLHAAGGSVGQCCSVRARDR
jgi:hypothetical protein